MQGSFERVGSTRPADECWVASAVGLRSADRAGLEETQPVHIRRQQAALAVRRRSRWILPCRCVVTSALRGSVPPVVVTSVIRPYLGARRNTIPCLTIGNIGYAGPSVHRDDLPTAWGPDALTSQLEGALELGSPTGQQPAAAIPRVGVGHSPSPRSRPIRGVWLTGSR